MKMFLPSSSITHFVAWVLSPLEQFENHGGLVNHWELESQLFRRSKLDSEFEVFQSLVVPLQSNDSPDDAFENMNLNAHCSPPLEPYNPYQHNLQMARRSQRLGKIKSYVQWLLPSSLKVWLDRYVRGQPVLQNGQQAGLTEQETVAIFGWTSNDYHFINPIAWGTAEIDVDPYWSQHESDTVHTCSLYRADVWPEIEVLLRALDKLPPAQPLKATLWRGSGLSAEELGPVITGHGFSSTSHNFDAALNFATRTLWAIENYNSGGKDISNLSAFPSEEEVLLPMGYRLEVVECSPTIVDDAMQQKILERMSYGFDTNITVVCMRNAAAPAHDVPSPAPAPSWYKTIEADTNHSLCVNLNNGSIPYNGIEVGLHTCSGADSEIWAFDNYQIRYGADESYCIDTNNRDLFLWECNGVRSQTWGYDFSASSIYSTNSSMCLDHWSTYNYDSSFLTIFPCNGFQNQTWRLRNANFTTSPEGLPQVIVV